MSSPFFISLCLCVALCCSTEYPHSLTLHENYQAYWKYDNETETFYFKVEVKNVTGWIAFGVSRLLYPRNPDLQWNFRHMEYYDVIVGGIDVNSTIYYKDCLTDGHKVPKVDASQDWNVTSLTEVKGVTTMVFHRFRNTSDRDGDNVIDPGRRRIVWAYHNTSDDIENRWQKHTEKGFKIINFLEEEEEGPVVENYQKTDKPTTGAQMIAASLIGNLLLIITVVIFCY